MMKATVALRAQQRREHPHGDQRRSRAGIAQVVAEHQPQVGAAQIEQDADVADRQYERRDVHPEACHVLAQHDLEIGGRQREENLVRSQPPLIRPDVHRQGGNEEQEQQWKPGVELIEVREVLKEEAVLPERSRRAEKDEDGDEDVAGRVAEVQEQVAPGQSLDHGHACPVNL